MKSITRTLLISNLTVTLCILLLSGLGLYLLVCDGFRAHFDWALSAQLDMTLRCDEVTQVIDGSNTKDERAKATRSIDEMLDLERSDPPENWTYIQILSGDGPEYYRSPTLGTGSILPKNPRADLHDELEFSTVILPNGNQGRLAFLRLGLRQHYLENEDFKNTIDGRLGSQDEFHRKLELQELPEQLLIAVAHDASGLIKNYRFLRNALFFVGAVTLSLMAASIWLVTWRGIQPVERLATEIESLDELDMQARLRSRVPIELGVIKNRLNGYLDRIESAFEREREFSDDVAHELRTPLAALTLKLDYGLHKSRSESEYQQLLVESKEVADNLEMLVGRLLSLARLESGSLAGERESVDTGDLLRLAWESLAADKVAQFDLQWDIQANCMILTNVALLTQLMVNLFDNAMAHVDVNGTIRIGCVCKPEGVLIDVRNTGCQIAPEEIDHVFSRLWRGDSSRTNSHRHSGIGLSIAQRIVSSLQGNITANSTDGWFQIKVTFPNQPAPKSFEHEKGGQC